MFAYQNTKSATRRTLAVSAKATLLKSCLLGCTALVSVSMAQAQEVEVAVRYGVTPVGDGTARIEDDEFIYMMPDGTIVFYDYGDHSLVRANMDGTTTVLLSSSFYNETPDGGTNIAYIDNDTQNLWRMDASTGVNTSIATEAYSLYAHGTGGDILYSTWSYDLGEYGLTLGNADGATNLFYENDVFNGITLYESEPYSSFVRADGTALITLDTYPYTIVVEGSGSGMTMIYEGTDTAEPFYLYPYQDDGYVTLLDAPAEQWGFHLNPADGGYNLITDGSYNFSEYLLTADNGDIYFAGQDGIYFYDADAASDPFSLLIDGSASTWSSFPVGVTSRGDLVYMTQDGSGVDSINLYYTNSGNSVSLLSEGDAVGNQTLTTLYGDYDYSYNSNNIMLEDISFNNDMVAVYGYLDSGYEDYVIFRITIYTESGDTFVWEGRCGVDGNWHATCNTDENNWTDVDTGEVADSIPGSAGTGSVTITSADVTIVDASVHVKSLSATGSLMVKNGLTLDNASSIQNLSLEADLTTNGALTLTGENTWTSGKIAGTGSVSVGSGHSLTIATTGDSLDFETSLFIGGWLVVQQGSINTYLVDILPGGELELQNGFVGATNVVNAKLTNWGTIRKTGSEISSISTDLIHKSGAILRVEGGALALEGSNHLNGNVYIAEGAALDLGFNGNGLNFMCYDCETLTLSGPGRMNIVSTMAWDGTTNIASTIFNFTGENGGLIIKEGAELKILESGAALPNPVGGFTNLGNVEFIGGTIKGLTISNEGNFLVKDDATWINSALLNKEGGTVTFENIDVSPSLIENWGTIAITGSEYESFIESSGSIIMHQGVFSVADGSTVVSWLNGTDQNFRVKGNSSIEGGGIFAIGNSGTLFVESGASLDNKLGLGEGNSGYFYIGGEVEGYGTIDAGNITGEGTFTNLGNVSFASGAIDGTLYFSNQSVLTIEGSRSDERYLDTLLSNTGNSAEVTQTATLTLGANGRIENYAQYFIDKRTVEDPFNDTAANITTRTNVAATNTNAFLNASGGTLSKIGTGWAFIEVDLINRGKIAVEEGNLMIRSKEIIGGQDMGGQLSLQNGSEIVIAEGAELTIFPSGPNVVTVTGSTKVINSGTLNLEYGLFSAGYSTALEFASASSSLIVEGGVFNWWKGDIDFGQFGNTADVKTVLSIASGSMVIKPLGTMESRTLNGQGLLIAEAEATIEQRSDLKLNGGATIWVDGRYILDGSLDPADFGQITSGSFILNSGGTLQVGSVLALSSGFLGVSSYLSGHIIVEKNSILAAPFTFNTVDGSNLIAGDWVLKDHATVTVGVSGSTSPDIFALKDGVSVLLSEGARLNNLPVVNGDFLIDTGAELTVVHSDFTVHGTLQNNGTLTLGFGSVTADTFLHNFTTGMIMGSGEINGRTVNDGVFSPGTSPGIITINGDYTQTSTGVLDIEIGGTVAGTEYDQLIVNGMATFESGSTINVTFLDLDGDGIVFTPSTGDTFDFLVTDNLVLAEGTSFGDYLTFTNIPQGLRWDYNPITVDGMTLWQLYAIFGSSFTEITGLTGNLLSVGTAFDTATTTTGSDGLLNLALVIGDLDSSSQLTSLSQASFNFASGLYDLSNSTATSMGGHMSARLDDLLWGTPAPSRSANNSGGPSAPQYASNSYGVQTDISTAEAFSSMAMANGSAGQTFGSSDGLRMGLTVSYENGKFDASTNQVGLDYDGYSLSTQLEYGDLDGGWIIGLSAAYADLSGNSSDSMGSVGSDGFGIGFYGSFKIGDRLVLDGSLMKSWGNVESYRSVNAGAESFVAMGKTDSDGLQISGRISAPMEYDSFRFAPFASLEYSKSSLDGFTESSESDGALMVSGSRVRSGSGQLGIIFATNEKSDTQANLSVAWDHTFKLSTPSLGASFLGAPSQTFSVAMDQRSKNAVRLNANIGKSMGQWHISAGYQGRIANDGNNHSLMARASMQF